MKPNEPLNKVLYNTIKMEASKKFKSPSGVYRSSWIVKEYLRRGGKYSGKKDTSSGISRWFKEDLKRPIKTGYAPCGRATKSGDYPLCRPSVRVNKQTPKTYKEISQKSIRKAKREKKDSNTISFGGSLGYLYGILF
jgi:hypothetical protein